MKNPNPLMLLRIGQGDAFGMAVEYAKYPRDQSTKDQALRFERYVKHPTHALRAGQYTDDTQMSCAISEVLLDVGPELRATNPGLRLLFAESFVRAFKRDPRKGYSRNFQVFLETVQDGQDFLKRIDPISDKNGAAMRSVPIGVLRDPGEVVAVAAEQARITHNRVGGVQSSILVALMSHFALYTSAPFTSLPEWLDQHCTVVPHDWFGEPVQGPHLGMNTADAVYTLLTTQPTLLDIARTTIEWGGDTDSVLAIAWGIASARMHEELPGFFDLGLEDGAYGRRFLSELGGRLMDKFTAPTFVPVDPQKSLA